jgi:hypothetical protein
LLKQRVLSAMDSNFVSRVCAQVNIEFVGPESHAEHDFYSHQWVDVAPAIVVGGAAK